MFFHVFDKHDKIKEIYFLRQLQHDEAERKVCYSAEHVSCAVSCVEYLVFKAFWHNAAVWPD